jgi:hypothetical protein
VRTLKSICVGGTPRKGLNCSERPLIANTHHGGRKLIAVVLIPALGCAAAVNADESMNPADRGAPLFSFSGFGTLGGVHSSDDRADFTNSMFKPNGAGYTHSWSNDVDTLIAGQVAATFTPKLSAVLQVISEQSYNNTYTPQVEWANINYQFTPDLSVRAGRTVLPCFFLSENRNVGYTYTWVRPPVEVYHLVPVTTNDGVDVSYRSHLGDLANTMQANAGADTAHLADNAGTAKARHTWGLSDTTELGAFTARLTYEYTNLTLSALDSFFAEFQKFGLQGAAIANRYGADHKPNRFFDIGAGYDPGAWFLMTEWASSQNNSFVTQTSAWDMGGGYRLGKLTPYVLYARTKADKLSDPGLNVSSVPAVLAERALGLNAELNSILSTNPVQSTDSVGTRWDFERNCDLKLQLDHTRLGAGSSGTFINIQPGFRLGGTVNLFSAAVDFVW